MHGISRRRNGGDDSPEDSFANGSVPIQTTFLKIFPFCCDKPSTSLTTSICCNWRMQSSRNILNWQTLFANSNTKGFVPQLQLNKQFLLFENVFRTP